MTMTKKRTTRSYEGAALWKEVERLTEEVERLTALMADCEAEHPPEPQYLAWCRAGQPDPAEAARWRAVCDQMAVAEALRELDGHKLCLRCDDRVSAALSAYREAVMTDEAG